jgi:hypothetical protein
MTRSTLTPEQEQMVESAKAALIEKFDNQRHNCHPSSDCWSECCAEWHAVLTLDLRDLVARVTEQARKEWDEDWKGRACLNIEAEQKEYQSRKALSERVAVLEGLLKKSRLYVQRQQHHAATANARQDACFVVAEIDVALNPGGPDAE